MHAEDDLEWKFIQSFGDDNSSDDDLVTAVEFDETGDYLAVGDKAGRICVFEGHAPVMKDSRRRIPIEYKFYTEFQSHEPEFDCLKSVEIEEKINMIKWCKPLGTGLFLLATNDKTIKLWKVHEKKIKRPARFVTPVAGAAAAANQQPLNTGPIRSPKDIVIPKLTHAQTITTATPKKIFANAHGYHINSIAVNCDGETFLSADDLRINLWNINHSQESFNIVDVKPANLEELTEVITSASFHPFHCNIMIYSSSRGSIRLCDLRDSALIDTNAKSYETEEDYTQTSFFSEIISSISDAKFTPDGRFLLARDYLTLKLWDIRMETSPVLCTPIHEYLREHLSALYENDCIFDKFECASSPDGTRFLSGSYNNNFVIYHTESKTSITIEALKDPPRRPRRPPPDLAAQAVPGGPGAGIASLGGLSARAKAKANALQETFIVGNACIDVNRMDFGKKALHVAWHPRGNTVAVAGLNKLYIYQAWSVPSQQL